MAFITSSETFQGIFMEPDTDPEVVRVFLDGVAQYLGAHRDIVEANLLEDCILKGEGVSGFMCQPDVSSDMADAMIEGGVPFVAVTEKMGNYAFLIRSEDEENMKTLRTQVLQDKAHYCQVVSGNEFEKMLARSKEKDKNVLYIGGLSETQAEMLRAKCGEIMDGEPVGIDEMEDGTYSFSFIGKKAMKKAYRDQMSFNMAFVQMLMESKGFRGAENTRIAQNQATFSKFLAGGARARTGPEKWIVGDGPHYIKLSGNGFEYGAAVTDGDTVSFEELYTADVSLPDFNEQLVSYAACIPAAAVTTDRKLAMDHFLGRTNALSFARGGDDKIINAFEKELAAKADEIVMRKITGDRTMAADGHWDDKFVHYLGEMQELMETAANSFKFPEAAEGEGPPSQEDIEKAAAEAISMCTPPKGYTRDDISKLISISVSHGISIGAYRGAFHAMKHTQAILYEAHPGRAQDMEAVFGAAREAQGQEHGRTQGRGDLSRGY